MRRFVLVSTMVIAIVACNNGDGNVTGPTVPNTGVSPSGGQMVNGTPAAPVTTPEEENAKGDNPGPVSVTFNKSDGSGRLCNSAPNAPRGVSLFYTKVLDESVRYIPDQKYTVPAKGCVDIPSAADVLGGLLIPEEQGCDPFEWEKDVQIDATAGEGEHIGHVIVHVSLSAEAGEGTWKPIDPIFGEWIDVGECVEVDLGTSTREICYGAQEQHRKRTNRWQNSCTEKIREEVVREKRKVRCEIECPCVEDVKPVKVEREFVPSGEWSECELTPGREAECKRWREGILTITRTYSCGRVEVQRRKHRESEACECPPPALCYYRVSCGEQEFTASTRECDEHAQQSICEAAIGSAGDNGIWRNFGDANLLNHCQFNYQGYINRDFQLTPGQSALGCFNKNSDD